MYKSIFNKIKISNILVERSVKLLYTIVSLYLGANYFVNAEFLIVQQIALFQSFLIFVIALPVPAILIRFSNSNAQYFKSLVPGTFVLRLLICLLSILSFFFYLILVGNEWNHGLMIIAGLIPGAITLVLLIEIIPHALNFEGQKNWELIGIVSAFFIIKISFILFFRSLHVKIGIELIEAVLVAWWCHRVYLKQILKESPIKGSVGRLKRVIRSSWGLYLNGILSVLILRIDQFALMKYVDNVTLSYYMLIVTLSSLFIIPLSLLSERLIFQLNTAKSSSLTEFKQKSQRFLILFVLISLILYIIYSFTFLKLGAVFFKRDLSALFTVGLILGSTIIWNSIGMVIGQINSVLNDGFYTMKRSFIGSVLLFIGVNIGFRFFGLLGVAIASSFSIFLTNVIFWFFSRKIRNVIL